MWPKEDAKLYDLCWFFIAHAFDDSQKRDQKFYGDICIKLEGKKKRTVPT